MTIINCLKAEGWFEQIAALPALTVPFHTSGERVAAVRGVNPDIFAR